MLHNKDDDPLLNSDSKKRALGDVEKLKKEIRDASPDDHLRRLLVRYHVNDTLSIAST